MSRIALLVIVAVWMAWASTPSADGAAGAAASAISPAAGHVPANGPITFVAGYALLVLGLAAWGRWGARRMALPGSDGRLRRFNQAMCVARLMIPAWLAVGLFVLDWGTLITNLLGRLATWPTPQTHLELPALLVGVLPALLAWMALWWAQYPADRALREQSVLHNLYENLPVHAPPTLRQTFDCNLRLQVAFTLVPIWGIVLLRDLATIGLWAVHVNNTYGIDQLIEALGMASVYLFSPLLLCRVLRTEPLPDNPLRRRMEQMCRDAGLGYRQILLWHTEHCMGNAAVMGLFPRVRYILLSDLLMETMNDRQIEAVFAHELGHVVHRHMLWYVVFLLIVVGLMAGPVDVALSWLQPASERVTAVADGQTVVMTTTAAATHAGRWAAVLQDHWKYIEPSLVMAMTMGSFLLLFWYLSPRFERQADVFAARTLQRRQGATGHNLASADPDRPETAFEFQGLAEGREEEPAGTDRSYVGEYGAGVFASALHRVAVVNNIPVTARNWSHGSIAQRMRYLHEISGDPALTARFDRRMRRLFVVMLLCLCTFGAWGLTRTFATAAADSARALTSASVTTVKAQP